MLGGAAALGAGMLAPLRTGGHPGGRRRRAASALSDGAWRCWGGSPEASPSPPRSAPDAAPPPGRRFRAETLADDAFVAIPSQPDPEVADKLASMPGVIDATSFVYLAVTLPGVAEGGGFAAAEDRLLRTVQRGRLVEGRRSDPAGSSAAWRLRRVKADHPR